VAGSVAVGECHVRLELAWFGLKARTACRLLTGACQASEAGRGFDAGPESGGLAPAETASAGKTHLERRLDDLSELMIEIAREGFVHVAEKAQGEVILFRVAPGCAGHIG